MSDPTAFLHQHREDAPKRPAAERILDWKDLYEKISDEKLRTQASRCMDCGVPFCQGATGCPVENAIPDWNDLVSQGRWDEALRSLHATNNFPEFTGKLCPAPCESACVLGISDEPVTIRNIESSIIERGFAEGRVLPIKAERASGKRIAIVGSGPAGLAAAQQLARAGHTVVVYERAKNVGGLLRYGIPDFKFEKHLIDRRIAQMCAEGVEFKTGVEIGRTIRLEKLRSEYDAVALAIGAESPRDLLIPGRELSGIHFAMDYLTQRDKIDARGKRVVILGGGDTGSDCLGTALRQGAVEVHQFELMPMPGVARDATTPWPLWPMKLRTSHAHEEGGHRRWNVSTTAFIGDANGVHSLRGVEVRKTAKGFDAVAGTEFELPVDMVLLALGFTGVKSGEWMKTSSLALNARGTLAIDSEFRTSLPGVFAAGDATRGASLIVWAIAEGRKMADAIDRSLSISARKTPTVLEENLP